MLCFVCLLLCKVEGSSPVSAFAITERRDMGLYDITLPMSLLGLGMGTMLVIFHSFKHAREECESKKAYVF